MASLRLSLAHCLYEARKGGCLLRTTVAGTGASAAETAQIFFSVVERQEKRHEKLRDLGIG